MSAEKSRYKYKYKYNIDIHYEDIEKYKNKKYT